MSSKLPSEWNWRNHLIHLFSFSKSYCIPGSRLGAVAASYHILEKVETVLDSLQICAPKHAQVALPPLLPALRPFIQDTAQAIASRQELFRQLLPEKWILGSQGAFFAFVKHPFKGVSARDVCYRLASEIGIVALPIEFFAPTIMDGEGRLPDYLQGWIRFSIGNVTDEKVKEVCKRLSEAENRLGWPMQ